MKKYMLSRQDLCDCTPLRQEEYNSMPEISELLCTQCTFVTVNEYKNICTAELNRRAGYKSTLNALQQENSSQENTLQHENSNQD